MVQTRCDHCGAFVKAESPRCRRCERATRALGLLTQRAERALNKVRQTSRAEHWRLPKLLRAIAAQRRRMGVGRERWEGFVHRVFGSSTKDLVDPRQMHLFVTEAPCHPPTASPSPKLSRSA
jgi:hypothetical protein